MKKLYLLYLIILPAAMAVIYFVCFGFKCWNDSLGFYLWSVSAVAASIIALLIAYTLGPLVKEIQDIVEELKALKEEEAPESKFGR